MNDTTKCFRILGISGSLRRGSYNTALLRTAAELVPGGVELTVFDGLGEIPPYDDDLRQAAPQPSAEKLKDAIRNADAVLIATPEYNHGLPGVLKNAIDWVSRPVTDNPLRDKPVAIMGASTSLMGTLRAQLQLRDVLDFAHVLRSPEVLVSAADTRFDEQGALTDETSRDFVKTLVTDLVGWAEHIQPREKDVEEAG